MANQPVFGRTYISFDWALKRLLRNKASFVILEGFLTELLQQDIRIKNLLESESNVNAEDEKSNRVDLLCENYNRELVIIEIQYHSELDYFQRMLFGTSKLTTEYLNRGQAYRNVRKVYSVNILYFDLGQGDDYIYHGAISFNGAHLNDQLKLSKNQQKRFGRLLAGDLYPEYFILKINNFDNVARSPIDEWIYYLKTSELPINFTAKGLSEVEQQLKINNMSPELLAKYMKAAEGLNITESMIETAYEEGEFNGLEKGLEKGIEKGIEKGKALVLEQMVVNAFSNDLSVKLIAEIVEIPENEVKAILVKRELL